MARSRQAVSGAGRVLLIEGPAGIGKTALLDQLRRRAEAVGMSVRLARGGELERGFGFGSCGNSSNPR